MDGRHPPTSAESKRVTDVRGGPGGAGKTLSCGCFRSASGPQKTRAGITGTACGARHSWRGSGEVTEASLPVSRWRVDTETSRETLPSWVPFLCCPRLRSVVPSPQEEAASGFLRPLRYRVADLSIPGKTSERRSGRKLPDLLLRQRGRSKSRRVNEGPGQGAELPQVGSVSEGPSRHAEAQRLGTCIQKSQPWTGALASADQLSSTQARPGAFTASQ